MGQRINRLLGRRRTSGALLAVTALISTVLVSTTAGISSADPVSTTVPLVCVGADAKTAETLNLAKALIGTDKIFVDLIATAKDIPARAGLDQAIDSTFSWSGTMDQNLIDKSAELGIVLDISNLHAKMAVKGPADLGAAVADGTFSSSGANAKITPAAGKPAVLNIGKIGGPITTTAGGIITYRVAGVTLTAALSVKGQSFVLNLTCAPSGSNLITKTTVKDPDAPAFNPEVVQREAEAGGTVTVDMNGVVTAGKTPLIADSLKIVEAPAAGTATMENGILTFQAPNEAGTYSVTVEACGEPKPESGMPGINEVQRLQLGDNWKDEFLGPRPVAFTLKVGEEETDVIWTAETVLGPLLDPLPRGGKMPNSKDWAPENRAGQVNDYLVGIAYKRPKAATIQKALEALPSIGAGNIVVTQSEEDNKIFDIEFIGDLAEQDVPQIELAGWFTVPPQEVLDRIGDAVAGALDGMGGDEEGGDTSASDALDEAAGMKPDDSPSKRVQRANDYMGKQIQKSIETGKPVPDETWDWWLNIVVINPIMDAVPAIIEWLNSLFPKKVIVSTVTPGEAPVPPEPLCSQGLVEVVVQGATVEDATATPAVLGDNADRPFGFTG